MSKKKRDFRNIKHTHFDPGQVLKASFSEQSSALRNTNVNNIIRDTYTHLVQELDDQGRPTKVEYFQANVPVNDTLTFTADVGGDKAGTYYTFTNAIDRKVYVLYQVVSGVGSAPNIGDIEIPVSYNANDPASVVTLANHFALKKIEDIIITEKRIMEFYVTLSYFQFGDTDMLDVGATGFTVNRTQEGDSIDVGEIHLSYDENGDPIHNSNVLAGLTFNPFTGSFEVSSGGEGSSNKVSTELEIINFNLSSAEIEQELSLPNGTKRFTLRSRNKKAKLKVGISSGGTTSNFFTLNKGANLSEECLTLTDTSLFVSSNVDSTVIELLVWK